MTLLGIISLDFNVADQLLILLLLLYIPQILEKSGSVREEYVSYL
jgi:hypothetical protein